MHQARHAHRHKSSRQSNSRRRNGNISSNESTGEINKATMIRGYQLALWVHRKIPGADNRHTRAPVLF